MWKECRASQSCEKWGWEEYDTSWESVVKRDDLDVIDICTSTNTHCDIAVAAAENRKHVLAKTFSYECKRGQKWSKKQENTS